MATVTTLAYKDVKTVMTKSSLPVGGYGKVGHVPGCEKLAAHHRSAQI